LSVCTCSTPTPAGPRTPDRYGAATWPLVIERQRLPRRVFRRSIAWLSDSLFTLRSAGCPPHAKLASGRWSGATGRAFHPQGSAEGFRICFLHLFLPSQAFLAQSMKPTRTRKCAVCPSDARNIENPIAVGVTVLRRRPRLGQANAGEARRNEPNLAPIGPTDLEGIK
jgi:hypothetical protein